MPSSHSPAEIRRLRTLEQLGAVDFVDDPTLQRVARLAAAITGTEGAGVHIIDGSMQHRIAAVGAPVHHWPRPDTLCEVVMQSDRGASTADATGDERFRHTSWATGDNPVRFYAAEPLRTDDDQKLGTLCIWDGAARPDPDHGRDALVDLAAIVVEYFELRRENRVYAEQAMTDELTGLPNRRLLLDSLRRMISGLGREPADVSVTVIDLDGFKQINDDHGHAIGDEVLRGIGERLLDSTRADEMCARLGGDEFVLVTTGLVDEAERAVERLLATVTQPLTTPVGPLSVEASAGTTRLTVDDTPDRALRRADVEMYLTKNRRSA